MGKNLFTKNGLKMGVWLSFFYKFAENGEFLIGRFLPYKLGIEAPGAVHNQVPNASVVEGDPE